MCHELSTHQDEVQQSSLQQPPAPSQGNENEEGRETGNDTTGSDTATSDATDGTDNTTTSTQVRVKQEDTTTNNTPQARTKQEPMEDNNNTNNNEEDNDELVNSDEKASCALNVLLDLDVGSLSSPDLKSKIMKVQEVCNSDAPSLQQQLSAMKEEIKQKNGIIKDIQDKNNIFKEQIERMKVQGVVTADSSTKSTTKEQTSPSVLSDESDAIANTSAIASSSSGNASSNGNSSSEDESNLKPAANPLIGSNVQVQLGKYKGVTGKVVSDVGGWLKIKPFVDILELNVRIENCKLVHDKQADIAAIKQYFNERTHPRQMIEGDSEDEEEDDAVDEEEDDGSIVAGRGPNGGADELIDSEDDNDITRMQARIAKSRKASNYGEDKLDEDPFNSDKSEDVSDKGRVAAAIEAVNTKYGVGLKIQKMLESSGHRGVTWTM